MNQAHEGEFSRRDFVKLSAAAAVVGVGIAGCASATRSGTVTAAASSTGVALKKPRGETIKVGLIGCGGRGTGAAVQALRADEGAVLTAMGDVFPDRLDSSLSGLTKEFGEDAARKIQVPDDRRFLGFDAYQKVIDSGVDVVLHATPPAFRPRHIEAAIAAGKHLFTEKPIAVDSTGVRKVRAACRDAAAKGLTVVAGFCWRYADAERETFGRVNRGAIGDIVTVHTTYHAGTLSLRTRRPEWSDMEFQIRNWWHFGWLSGDHIVEQAVHSVDRLSWAMGDEMPVRCTALGGRQARKKVPETGNAYDHFAVVYEYADGRRCFHTCRQMDGCPSDNTDYIYGTKGSCEINGWKPVHVIRDLRGRERWKYDGPSRDMYQNEHDALFQAIREGRPINDGERMCDSTLMAIMGRMGAYTGQVVTWEQAEQSDEDWSPAKLEWGEVPVAGVAIPGKK